MSVLSLGWNGSYRTWRRYEIVYLLLAGLATPLVVSVHSVVSMDFAAAVLPGWHSTIFPPYFVAGAIFSGMAMVLTLMLLVRKVMHLEDYITPRHVDAMTKLVLTTSCLVGLSYAIEFFTALYVGNRYESFTFLNRALGPLAWGFAIMVACNVLIPQLFWFRRVRRQLLAVFVICILVNVGMWMERFIIIVTSLERDFLPSSWSSYVPTLIELATLAGSFGLFFTCFLHFLPSLAGGRDGRGQGSFVTQAQVTSTLPGHKRERSDGPQADPREFRERGGFDCGGARGSGSRLGDCRRVCPLCRARPRRSAAMAPLAASGGLFPVRGHRGRMSPCGSSFGRRRGIGRWTSGGALELSAGLRSGDL